MEVASLKRERKGFKGKSLKEIAEDADDLIEESKRVPRLPL